MKRVVFLAMLTISVAFAKVSATKFESVANKMIQRLDKSLKFKVEKNDLGELLILGKIITITLAVDEQGNVDKMIFIGTGDGSQASGLVIFSAATASVAGLKGKVITPKESGAMLKKLGFMAKPNVFSGKNFHITEGEYDITSSFSKITGLMIIADTAKK